MVASQAATQTASQHPKHHGVVSNEKRTSGEASHCKYLHGAGQGFSFIPRQAHYSDQASEHSGEHAIDGAM